MPMLLITVTKLHNKKKERVGFHTGSQVEPVRKVAATLSALTGFISDEF